MDAHRPPDRPRVKRLRYPQYAVTRAELIFFQISDNVPILPANWHTVSHLEIYMNNVFKIFIRTESTFSVIQKTAMINFPIYYCEDGDGDGRTNPHMSFFTQFFGVCEIVMMVNRMIQRYPEVKNTFTSIVNDCANKSMCRGPLTLDDAITTIFATLGNVGNYAIAFPREIAHWTTSLNTAINAVGNMRDLRQEPQQPQINLNDFFRAMTQQKERKLERIPKVEIKTKPFDEKNFLKTSVDLTTTPTTTPIHMTPQPILTLLDPVQKEYYSTNNKKTLLQVKKQEKEEANLKNTQYIDVLILSYKDPISSFIKTLYGSGTGLLELRNCYVGISKSHPSSTERHKMATFLPYLHPKISQVLQSINFMIRLHTGESKSLEDVLKFTNKKNKGTGTQSTRERNKIENEIYLYELCTTLAVATLKAEEYQSSKRHTVTIYKSLIESVRQYEQLLRSTCQAWERNV